MPLFGNKTQKPWSPQDEARLKRVRLLSRLLDEQFRIPGGTDKVAKLSRHLSKPPASALYNATSEVAV